MKLFSIKCPGKYDPNDFPLIYINTKELTEYTGEKECLIFSGALMKIVKIQKINDKRYEVLLRIISMGKLWELYQRKRKYSEWRNLFKW